MYLYAIPDVSQIMLNLTCVLIPQEKCPQSAAFGDTPLLRRLFSETNMPRHARKSVKFPG
jgi:hypothetical protein